jgi:hypothetical protein
MTARAGETVWRRGRFDSQDAERKLLFGRMYEDSSIELGAFRPGGRVFCIASAGCTALQLAPRHEVVAVDLNPVQLAYAQRRCAGNLGARGSAERVMALGRAFAPVVGWWPSRVRAFLELDRPKEQAVHWLRFLDTRRFRVTFDTLLSLRVLKSVYAPGFLGFLPPRLGAVMRGRMERCFTRHPNRTNPYARALLLGELSEAPPSPEAAHIRFVEADAAAFLEREDTGSFDGFALSNILDGADSTYEQRLFAAVKRAAAPGAMVVLRSFREPGAPLATNRAAEDRAMLWGIVDVRPAAAL